MRAIRHLCLVVLFAGAGCTVTLPGAPAPRSTLQPITRPEMLRSLLRIAVNLESRAAVPGGPVTRDACRELSELLERNLWNPGGGALNGNDDASLNLAELKCVKEPGAASYLIIDTLSDSRPPGNFSYPHVPRQQVLARSVTGLSQFKSHRHRHRDLPRDHRPLSLARAKCQGFLVAPR